MQLKSLRNGLHQKLNEKKTKEEIRLSVVSINFNINEYVKLAACRRETKSTNFSIDRKSTHCISLTLNEIDRYANLLRCACRLTVANAATAARCLHHFLILLLQWWFIGWCNLVWLSLSCDFFLFVCCVSTVPVMFFYV